MSVFEDQWQRKKASAQVLGWYAVEHLTPGVGELAYLGDLMWYGSKPCERNILRDDLTTFRPPTNPILLVLLPGGDIFPIELGVASWT